MVVGERWTRAWSIDGERLAIADRLQTPFAYKKVEMEAPEYEGTNGIVLSTADKNVEIEAPEDEGTNGIELSTSGTFTV